MKWNIDPVGELVYCKYDKLKYFLKNQIYKIEKVSNPPSQKLIDKYKTDSWRFDNSRSDGKIKLEGVKGYHPYSHFTFVENNVALFRDVQISQIMDIQCHHGKNSERIINTSLKRKNTF